jgi:protein-S-isoprenylcysteine O-methyltransferase Ste14
MHILSLSFVHHPRAIRDDEICAEKYGDDWDEYKRRVPYWFVPYVI